jgi:signal-transduction protein with cAMP-binding, CBS, and nucleotidyltransferase domain
MVAREELAAFRVEVESQTTVREIMTPMVFSVDETASVQEVASAMITGRIHRVLVTRHNKMVGIISSLDLLSFVRDM